jgi:phage gpG-like protein
MFDLEEKLRDISNLANKTLTIGIQGGKGEQKKLVRTISQSAQLPKLPKSENTNEKKPKRSRFKLNDNLTVEEVALYQEEGTKTKLGTPAIPSRSFIKATFDQNKEMIRKTFMSSILKSPTQSLELVGAYVVGLIQSRIASGIPPALNPKTIKRKGSSKPLIDTGQLRNSITFKIGDKA